MRLPNGERADLDAKLEEYLLNPDHPKGKHKAWMFESRLGITLENAGILGTALLAAAANSDHAEARGDNGFGGVFVVTFPLSTAKGSAIVSSVWIIRHGEDFPRLITCYII
jgi:hypothetical protein